jgi:phosphonate transport system substrate-binding protein
VKLLQTKHPTRPLAILLLFQLILLGLSGGLSSCGTGPSRAPTITPTLTLTATFPPTLTPTPVPLGSPANPYIIGLVSEDEDPQAAQAAGELAKRAAERSNLAVRGMVYPSYSLLMNDFSFNKVHIAWLPPLTYLYASQQGLADVILLTNHFGVYQYGTQFMANVDSNFTPYYDPVSGYNSVDAATALSQFQDMRPCWVDTQSPSGYIVPAGLLKMNQITTLPPVITQNHSAVIRALYIKGICDFGAAFSYSGDPRTASAVQQDLPDSTNRIVIIWRSDPVIPNLNLSFTTRMPEQDRQALAIAFTEIAKMDDGKGLLTLSAGNYQVDDVRMVNDRIYQPLRDMVRALDLDLRETIGK